MQPQGDIAEEQLRKYFTVGTVDYTITAGSAAVTAPASSLLVDDRRTCWSTSHKQEWLVLRLSRKSLVSYLRIVNKVTLV